MEFLPERIKEQRKLLELTQAQFAEKLNMSLDSVKKMETNKMTPSVETLTKISELFNISTDYLLGITDIPIPIYLDDIDSDVFLHRFETIGEIINKRKESLTPEEKQKISTFITDFANRMKDDMEEDEDE